MIGENIVSTIKSLVDPKENVSVKNKCAKIAHIKRNL